MSRKNIILPEGSGKKGIRSFFDHFSNKATQITGSPHAFIIALAAVLIWAITGPVFGYSDTWQLIINTSTTIITFLMVFLIQQAQNKDTVALHVKLDELIASNKSASNRLVDAEDLNEEELKKLKAFYVSLRGELKNQKEIHEVRSIDHVEDEVKRVEETDKGAVKEVHKVKKDTWIEKDVKDAKDIKGEKDVKDGKDRKKK